MSAKLLWLIPLLLSNYQPTETQRASSLILFKYFEFFENWPFTTRYLSADRQRVAQPIRLQDSEYQQISAKDIISIICIYMYLFLYGFPQGLSVMNGLSGVIHWGDYLCRGWGGRLNNVVETLTQQAAVSQKLWLRKLVQNITN